MYIINIFMIWFVFDTIGIRRCLYDIIEIFLCFHYNSYNNGSNYKNRQFQLQSTYEPKKINLHNCEKYGIWAYTSLPCPPFIKHFSGTYDIEILTRDRLWALSVLAQTAFSYFPFEKFWMRFFNAYLEDTFIKGNSFLVN